MLAPVALPAEAQRSLATPRGTGRPAIHRTVQLPEATDLARDGAIGNARRKPILLFFDRQECGYCERALREYLVPMSREDWKERAIFRQVDIDRALPLTDFDGTPATHEKVAARYGVSLSPTVIVVDGDGRPLADPLVGLLTVDFYGAYVENVLAAASKQLASRPAAGKTSHRLREAEFVRTSDRRPAPRHPSTPK